MNEKGIDIFNKSDPFYNDICFSYNENGKDVILEDRKKDYYQNINFCKDNCKYNNINYNSKTISCDCDPPIEKFDLGNNEIKKKKNLISFIKSLFGNQLKNLNVEISKCYSIPFKLRNLRYNIGFIFGSFINTTEIVMLFFFFKYGFESINSQIFHKIKQNELEEFKIKKKFSNNLLDLSNSSFRLNQIISDLSFTSSIQIISKKQFYENLPYNLALHKDKRSFGKIIKHNFKEKFYLTRMLEKITIYEFTNVKIIVFLSYLEIMFSIEGFLYTTSQISKDYHNQLKIKTHVLYSFYCFLLGNLVLRFLKYMIEFSKTLGTYVEELKIHNVLVKRTMKYLKILKIKFFVMLFINFFILLFFWYYMTIFCYIYHFSQIKWFIRGWVSFIFYFIYCLIFSFIFTVFRYFGLYTKNQKLYNLSLYIKQLL